MVRIGAALLGSSMVLSCGSAASASPITLQACTRAHSAGTGISGAVRCVKSEVELASPDEPLGAYVSEIARHHGHGPGEENDVDLWFPKVSNLAGVIALAK